MIEPLLKSELEPVVRRQRSWLRGRMLAVGWGAVAVLGVIAFLWQKSADLSFSFALPLLILAAVVVLLAAWFRAGFWEPDYREIARRIESHHPELHALLLTAVEQKPEPATGKFHFLQQRVIDDAVRETRNHQWIDSVSGGQLFGWRLAQLASLALLVLSLANLGSKASRPGGRAADRLAPNVTVTPGDATVERGSGLVIFARFDGKVPAEASLVFGSGSNDIRRVPLTRTLSDPVFGGSIAEVTTNLTYRIEFAGKQTRDYTVNVFDYPALRRSDARIQFPEYTGLPEKRIEETRRVSAVEGSKLEFSLQFNKPVASARFVSRDKSNVVALAVETNRPLAKLEDFALLNSSTFDLQLVDADGRTNKVPAQFVLEALKNRRPELKIQSPRGDQRVSALEEVNFAGEAWDDFGLRDYGLSYTLAGQEPKTISLGGAAGPNERRQMTHLLKLEELGVQPDQLVSWFLWADDIGPDGQVRRTSSDMYFAEVRPFEEIFREAQSANEQSQSEQQQGQGNEATKLAELQKQIINATWRLQRNEIGPKPSPQYGKDAPVVLQSQEKALEQAEALGERASDPRAKALVANVVEAMEKAVDHLTKATNSTASLPPALESEQAAYQALLKLSAREYQVSRSRNQRGNQSANSMSQQQLEQLDFKNQEDRYETQRQASSQQQNAEQREQLQVLNRLKELAQRQQDLNQRIKELQNALQEAKTDQEKEEIKRRLKRLREEEQEMLADVDELQQRMDRPENQSRMADARQQLERTRGEVQQAAEALDREQASQALASGSRAERELEKLRDDFRKKNSSQFTEEMRQMRNDARELSQKQEEIGQQLDALKNERRKTLSDGDKKQELAQQLEQQRGGLTNLLSNMRSVTEKAENVEPLLSRQLYDTLRETSQGTAENSLSMSRELLQRGFPNEATPFEQKARGEIDQIKRGVEKAAESVLGDDVESLRQAKRELDALASELEREVAQNDPQAARAGQQGQQARQRDSQPSQQGQQGANARDGSQQASAQNQEQQEGGAQGGQQESMEQQNQNGGQRQRQQANTGGRGTNQLARAGQGQAGQRQQPGEQQNQQGQQGGQGEEGQPQSNPEQASQQQGQNAGNQSRQQQAQSGQQSRQGQQGGQRQQGEQGQQGQQGEQAQQNQDGKQGQQGQQAQQGQQGQRGQAGQQGQQGQQQQPGQQAQQAQEGQQGQGQAQQAQQGQQGQQGGRARTPAVAQGNTGEVGGQTEGRDSDRQDVTGRSVRRNFFDLNRTPSGSEAEANGRGGPLTGENFANWSDRLRDVEEMLDEPELRGDVARIRDRARALRSEIKRHAKLPQWDLVRTEISAPLVEVRDRVAEELARREKPDSLVPIDRDPVPTKFSELVKRYYEKLGRE